MSRRKKLINNSSIPQHEIENIARILLPDILAYHESEEGQQEFAEWKAARETSKRIKTPMARTPPDDRYKTKLRDIYSRNRTAKGMADCHPLCAFIQFS